MLNLIKSTDFEGWLQGLTGKTKSVVLARLARMRMDNFGTIKHIEGNVFEAKIDHGPGIRIYYFRSGKEVYVLLCGGDKSTQKKDIKKALELVKILKKDGDTHDKNSNRKSKG